MAPDLVFDYLNGTRWHPMELDGTLRMPMALYGCRWDSTDADGTLWHSMALDGTLRMPMALNGPLNP